MSHCQSLFGIVFLVNRQIKLATRGGIWTKWETEIGEKKRRAWKSLWKSRDQRGLKSICESNRFTSLQFPRLSILAIPLFRRVISHAREILIA